MKRVQRRPYLTPRDDRITVEQWTQQVDGHLIQLEQRLPGWDPGSDIYVRSEVSVDVEGIYRDCRLEGNAELRLVLLWESPGTKLRGSGSKTDFSHATDRMTALLTAHIDGKLLADRLHLYVKLLFVNPGSTHHGLLPRVAGSILLDLPPYEVQLEGDGARFPIEIIDFRSASLPHNAGWFLSWEPDDLEQPLLRDVRLYINSQHSQIVSAIRDMRPEANNIREALRLDVAQTLVRGVLDNEDFSQNPDRYASGTIGAAVRAMVRLYFEGYQVDGMRTLLRSPHWFSAHLQDKIKIFGHE